jgi:RNA polymerase sigma factor (sigma-70 family)
MDPDELQTLLRRARKGSQEAARQLFDRYAEPVRFHIRRRMRVQGKIRRAFDSEDFLQRVFKSFFVNELHHRAFDGPAQFLAFLRAMADNTVRDEMRAQFESQKRDLGRQCSVDDAAIAPDRDLVARHPSPAETAAANDYRDHLRQRLPERLRPYFELLCQGCSAAEMARRLGKHETTIRRMLQQVRVRLHPAG